MLKHECVLDKKTSFSLLIRILVVVLMLGGCSSLWAQDDTEGGGADAAEEAESGDGEAAEGEEGSAAPSAAIYLPIKPQFVVNYGGAGRLRYLKAEVSVRLSTTNAAHAVREHLPYVRNNLVMIFASQTNETVSSQEGKEQMLIDARESIRDILERENSIPREEVVDVYFNTFFVQK
ncbi:hypothetical protein TDB9533_01872 [Thalassocella blandensis]|nr:hypothetical protein TDB9533_01872 [Thalassocella blandensis]